MAVEEAAAGAGLWGGHGAGKPLPHPHEELGPESRGDAGRPVDLRIGELVWTSARAASLRGVSNALICSGSRGEKSKINVVWGLSP